MTKVTVGLRITTNVLALSERSEEETWVGRYRNEVSLLEIPKITLRQITSRNHVPAKTRGSEDCLYIECPTHAISAIDLSQPLCGPSIAGMPTHQSLTPIDMLRYAENAESTSTPICAPTRHDYARVLLISTPPIVTGMRFDGL